MNESPIDYDKEAYHLYRDCWIKALIKIRDKYPEDKELELLIAKLDPMMHIDYETGKLKYNVAIQNI